MNGVINIFKPKGMTSFDVVREVKKICSTGKVGHTGTLVQKLQVFCQYVLEEQQR